MLRYNVEARMSGGVRQAGRLINSAAVIAAARL